MRHPLHRRPGSDSTTSFTGSTCSIYSIGSSETPRSGFLYNSTVFRQTVCSFCSPLLQAFFPRGVTTLPRVSVWILRLFAPPASPLDKSNVSSIKRYGGQGVAS